VNRRATVAAVVGALAVAIVIVVMALGGSDDTPAPAQSTTSSVAAATGGSSPAIAGNIVTVVGTVQKVEPSGDFVINDGHVDYTIAMSPAVKIEDLGGAELSRDAIQVSTSIQVTGPLTDSTISAQTVVVPTGVATPPTTS